MVYSSNGKGDTGLQNSDSGEKCTNLQSVTVVETEVIELLVMPISTYIYKYKVCSNMGGGGKST